MPQSRDGRWHSAQVVTELVNSRRLDLSWPWLKCEMGGLAEALRVLHGCVSLGMRLEEVGAP